MKNKRILLVAFVAASVWMSGTGARALSITTSDYEIGGVVNSGTLATYQFGNPLEMVPTLSLAPVSVTLQAPDGSHDKGGNQGGNGGNQGGTVPDGGSTVMLLGAAVLGLTWARSKLARS